EGLRGVDLAAELFLGGRRRGVSKALAEDARAEAVDLTLVRLHAVSRERGAVAGLGLEAVRTLGPRLEARIASLADCVLVLLLGALAERGLGDAGERRPGVRGVAITLRVDGL